MNIVNTIPHFLNTHEKNQTFSITNLEEYYTKFPSIFKQYFPQHCPKTEERLSQAIANYPRDIESIESLSKILPSIIKTMYQLFVNEYNCNPNLNFYLLVGGYGSNAFVERKIIGDIYFAAEKLSPNLDHLKVIVAHEIGHVYHNVLSNEKEMDWKTVDWEHGLISLYREGIATYFSQKMVKNLEKAVYFSYNDEGQEWLDYYLTHKDEVKKKFLEDVMNDWTFEKEKEWFRLSGGSYFGYNRLGYYLGTDFVHHLIELVGEEKTVIYWCHRDIKTIINDWLQN